MKTVGLSMDKSVPGKRAIRFPECDVPTTAVADLIPADLIRQAPANLPELSELEVIRHFTQLASINHGIDVDFYPLGSCTMKYNPRVNEEVARLPGVSATHPQQPADTIQGNLRLMHNLELALCEILGMDRITFQPAAGAQGELTGMLMIKAYLQSQGETQRNKVIVPDSAHGTNPATVGMAGFEVIPVASRPDGSVDLDSLRSVVGDDTAALMMTNPSTLGLFDPNVQEIVEIVHQAGGLAYYDGANMNAILGYARPGDMGFDVIHVNLHKTFSTPHGGGGPGSGPVGVKAFLAPFLPVPTVERRGDSYILDWDLPHSIGKVHSFLGNFGVVVRAYAYLLAYGSDLTQVAEYAVLNANYMLAHLRRYFDLPVDRHCLHEFVLSAKTLKGETGIRVLDIAKRLLDEGVHPPTIYFPLIIEEALMIEPTETESKETLDRFIAAMAEIHREAHETPEKLRGAPYKTPVGRLDEATAARRPNLRYRPE